MRPPAEARIVVPWGPREIAVAAALVAGLTAAVIGLLTLVYRDSGAPFLAIIAGTFLVEVSMLAVAIRFGPAGIGRAAFLLGPRRLGMISQFGWGAVAFLGSLIAGAVYIAIASLISEDLTPTPLPIDVPDSGLRWVAFATIVLVGPFSEEVFFRGFVFAGLLRRFSLPAAVLISSALFAVAHLDIAVAGPAFLAGSIYALVYWRTGSVWPAVLAHTAQNAVAFGLTAA